MRKRPIDIEEVYRPPRPGEQLVDRTASWWLELLAGTLCVLGLAGLLMATGLLLRGYQGWHLLTSGDFEAIDACTKTPSLDCNPTGWKTGLSIGIVFLATSVGLFYAAVRVVRASRA